MAGLTDEVLGRLHLAAMERATVVEFGLPMAAEQGIPWDDPFFTEEARAYHRAIAREIAEQVRAEQQQAADLRAAVQAAIDGWSMCYARREAERCGQCARCRLMAALAAAPPTGGDGA